MSAVISNDGLYRYWLERDLGHMMTPLTVGWVMLNPSTADASIDDPTIRRCISFSQREGATRMIVTNLYAYRATDPAQLADVDDPVGALNVSHVEKMLLECSEVIVGWGAKAADRSLPKSPIVDMLHDLSLTGGFLIRALAYTRDGHPRHPLYVRKIEVLKPWPQIVWKPNG